MIREFFRERGVIEVDTPTLGRATVTDPDVDGIPVPGYGYLQTSPEYFLKRLLAAGVPDCYQMGPVFREDETGRLHNPEFTLLEWYRLGFDHQDLMSEVAQLVSVVLGPGDFRTHTYAELVGDDLTRSRADLDLAFALACEDISGRAFIVDYPAEQAALARLNGDGQTASRFELVIDGIEVANGYWELTDRAEHERRFAADLTNRAQRGKSSREMDGAFLAALDAGLPDCAGVALGVDRLLMIALGVDSIEQVLTFRR